MNNDTPYPIKDCSSIESQELVAVAYYVEIAEEIV